LSALLDRSLLSDKEVPVINGDHELLGFRVPVLISETSKLNRQHAAKMSLLVISMDKVDVPCN